MPNTLQDEFRNDFIKNAKHQAWDILCQVAYLEQDCAEKQAEIHKLIAETDTIDEDIKKLDPELAHGDERKERQEKIKALNARKHEITQLLQGNLRQNGVRADGKPRIEGTPGLTDMVMVLMQTINDRKTEAQ